MGGIIVGAGIERAIGAEDRRDVGLGIFRRQGMGSGEQMLRRAAEIFHVAQQAGEPGLLRQIVAAAKQQGRSARQRAAEKIAPVAHARLSRSAGPHPS